MNQQMGLTEFFAMEAGGYLDRLDTLVSGPVGPDRDELVRLTRALRGSALMANPAAMGCPPNPSSRSCCAAIAAEISTPGIERAEPRASSPGGEVISNAGLL